MPGWFEKQLRARIQADEDIFSNALNNISEKISGKRVFQDIKEDEIANARSALEEIARFYNIPEDVLKRAESQGIKTLDEQMNFIFGSAGIMYRDVEFTEGWYNDASGVYFGATEDGEYIALMPDYRGYSYKDHNTGKRVRLNSTVMQKLSKDGLCFYRPMPARKLGVYDLLMHAVRSLSLSDFMYIIMITLLITITSMAAPYLTRIIYSQMIFSKNLGALTALFVFMIAAGTATTLFQIARSLVLSRIEVKINTAVNASVIMRLINLPATFFKNFSSGELAQRASSATILCSSVVNIVFSVGLTAVISLIYLQQIFAFTPILVMPALWIMVVLFVSSILSIWGYARLYKRKMILKSKEYGLVHTLITGIQKIKLSGAERRAFAKWGSIYKDIATLDFDPPLFLKLTPVIQRATTFIGTFVIYFRAYNSGVHTEDYMAFMASYGLLSAAFIAFCNLTLISATITPLIDLIKPILQAEPEISHGRIVPTVRGRIELNNVSFRYNDKQQLILNKISLKVNPGEYVAITGKSGCGKSTLMRLLLGFEKPVSGVIYYDGNDIKTLDLRSLRSHIGCVIQHSMLFPGSIYSNIVISAPELSEDDAWKAAEMAGVADDIRKMPMKMHTMISEGSGSLSGGQRQRIIIARAIASKPKILLFDEATSALDNLTQKIVSDSLEKLKCTRIIIAHRLSTVKHCNRILVLDNGSIAEEGSYDELISLKGLFASLVERQQLGQTV